VPLTKVTVTDPMAGLSAINCGGSGSNVIPSLAAGGSETCTATYTTTAGNVKAGSITNVGTATGRTPAGSTVKYNSSLTIPETGRPYSCKTPLYFLSESQSSSGPVALYHSTFPTWWNYLPYSPAYPDPYNAIGFDPTGTNAGYIYAMTRHAGGNELLRFDGTGQPTGPPVPITGYPAAPPAPVVGAFDPSGNYWVVDGGARSATAYEININNAGAPDVIGTPTLTAAFKPADWTYAQGFLWGLYGDTIYRVTIPPAPAGSPPLYTVNAYTLPFPVAAGVYGAAWTFSNGNPGFNNNATGKIYQISVTGTVAVPVFSLIYTYPGPQSANGLNDGTACAGADTDLGVVGTGPATVPPGGTITWNFTVTNDGPGNSSGFVLDDTVPAGVSDVTTSTPNCAVAGKGLEVQCADGELDNGDAYTVTVSGTAPASSGTCVTDKATVIANEADPDAKNNTSSVKTCTTGDTGLSALGQPRRRT